MLRLGIDIGGTGAKLGLVDDAGTLRCRARIATGAELSGEQLVRNLAEAVAALRGDEQPAGLGVAAPGCRRDDGEGVVNVTNLPHIDGFPLRRALEEATRLPTVLDNDANAAAVGEHRFGAGKGVRRLLVVTIGTGIGGGMVVDGAVHRVAWQGLGDAGHVIVAPNGPRCACGGCGCVEAVAAVPAILRMAGRDDGNLGAVVAAARAGDAAARSACETAGGHLGVALATLTHLLGPERILIGGGGMDAAKELLMAPLRAAFDFHAQPFFRERLTLDRAALGNDAGVIGAAALVDLLAG
jgi:glucokinase